MELEPYLFFNGRCEEAIEFYRQALGAKVEVMMRYKDSPEPLPPGMVPPGSEHKVMHTTLSINGTALMASDGFGDEQPPFRGFSLSLGVADKSTAQRLFAALGEGGKVDMPLAKTFWSPCFGMLTDRFGVGWMITVMSES